MSGKKVKVYKISIANYWCCVRLAGEVADVVSDMEPGDTMEVAVVEMTDDEFSNLPEFRGF